MTVPTSLRFTYSDYLLLPEDKRYELIDGELYLTPAPGTSHQRISRNLGFLLHAHVTERDVGEVLAAPCDVVLSETDVVQPDLLFVARERLEIIEEKYVSAAPDLVVEILSPSTAERDRTIKAKLYSRAGVRELWLASPEAQTVEVLVSAPEGWTTHALYARSQILRSPMFPHLELPLERVFAR
jgi:Uma2 family endonuclease